MARIRTIKPEFWTSEQVVECSTTARLLFVGLWNFCDDGGVHPASPMRIKMQVFPADQFSIAEVAALLGELKSAGLITEFESEGKSYYQVTGWHHQKIDRPHFRYPSSNGRRTVVEQTPSVPPRKGREGKGSNTPCSPPRGTTESSAARTKTRKQKSSGGRTPPPRPTLGEVQAYCVERNNGIDPEEFIAHYEANGWVQGRAGKPIRNWQAAVVTWEKQRAKNKPPPIASRLPTAEEDAAWTP